MDLRLNTTNIGLDRGYVVHVEVYRSVYVDSTTEDGICEHARAEILPSVGQEC